MRQLNLQWSPRNRQPIKFKMKQGGIKVKKETKRVEIVDQDVLDIRLP